MKQPAAVAASMATHMPAQGPIPKCTNSAALA